METGWNSEALLAEMEWVRRLARALVRDRALADDVSQEAWLVASEHRPDEDRPLRPWLARVVATLARTRRRGERRREQRELASDTEREVPRPDELVQRVELQRAVAAEVLALAEPHRSTLLLHFFEGMSSAEIARRLGIPDATVRRRLATGLERVREALRKREDPPRGGWLAALIPLAKSPPSHAAPAALGVFTVKKLVVGAILLALLLVGGAILWRRRTDASPQRGDGIAADSHAPRQLATVPAWLAQPEAPARRIAGHVRVAGAPAAGATVRLGADAGAGLLQPLAEVVVGADGAFDFGVQPAATFTVSASAPEHAAAAVVVANADPRAKPDDLVLELGDCSARIFGKVSDASGGVIEKARLTLVGLNGTESDAAGAYTLCLAPRDDPGVAAAAVVVEADGYGSIAQEVMLVGALHHDFVLVPEAVLVGRVVDSADRPIAGARVIARPDAVEEPHFATSNWTESDGDGRFRVARLQPGKFQLLATGPHLAMPAPMLAIARAAQTSREVRLVVVSTARIRGHVVRDGKPVAGAAVTAVRDGLPPGTPSVSQTDGSFVLDGVPFGPTSFTAPPYAVRAPTSLEVTRASIDDVTITVDQLATLRGRVTRKGLPVAGANVVVSAPRPPPHSGKTDASGQFVVEGIAAGDAIYSATDFATKSQATPRPIHFTDGQTTSVDIDLDSAGKVKGLVVDESGTPVPDVVVRMDATNASGDLCETLADARGEFDCTWLAGGEYAPSVAPSPGARHGFAPTNGDRFEPITVPRDGALTGVRLAIKAERVAIRGVVVDDTGAAMPDVHVTSAGNMDYESAYSDAGGRFSIDNLARGSYVVIAHAADGGSAVLRAVAAGGDDLTITIARPGAISGTLAGFAAPPTVHVLSMTSVQRTSDPAIVDGSTFSEVGLPPGRYLVEALAGSDTDGAAVDVRSGETTTVALHARAVGRVEGRVLELGTNKPLAGWHCEALLSLDGWMDPEAPPDDARQTTSDANGHYALPAPVGRVRTGCVPPPQPDAPSWAGADVDVTPGAVGSVVGYSVRPTYGANPGDPGLELDWMRLPLTVVQVVPGGPAATAGIAPGDHLVSIDGASLQGVLADGATNLLVNHAPGTTATLGIERGGTVRVVKITIAAPHN